MKIIQNSKEAVLYMAPAVSVIEVIAEGVLCTSGGTENSGEDEGEW